MKTKTILTTLTIAALIFCGYSCAPKGDGSVSVMDVNGNKMFVTALKDLSSATATIPLSDLVESLEVIQLEDHDDAFFRPWFTTVTEKYIGVRPREGRPFLLFDRSGKFLGNIGRVGQGPGEYAISPYDEIIDDKNELVYLAPFSGNKILVYSTSGAFLNEMAMPQRLAKAKLFLSDGVLSIVQMPFGEDSPMAYQVSLPSGGYAINVESGEMVDLSAENPIAQNSMQIINTLLPAPHFLVNSFDGEIFNTRNVEGVFDFTSTSSDTLYHFDVKNNRIVPFFTLTSKEEGLWKQYIQINKDLIFTGVFNFDSNIHGFSGNKFVASDLKHKTSSFIEITNDLIGNLPIRSSVAAFRNGYFVQNVQPEELMEEIEKRLSESSCTENDRQQLNALLSQLKEDTNNVVFVGKLKSEIGGKLF